MNEKTLVLGARARISATDSPMLCNRGYTDRAAGSSWSLSSHFLHQQSFQARGRMHRALSSENTICTAVQRIAEWPYIAYGAEPVEALRFIVFRTGNQACGCRTPESGRGGDRRIQGDRPADTQDRSLTKRVVNLSRPVIVEMGPQGLVK